MDQIGKIIALTELGLSEDQVRKVIDIFEDNRYIEAEESNKKPKKKYKKRKPYAPRGKNTNAIMDYLGSVRHVWITSGEIASATAIPVNVASACLFYLVKKNKVNRKSEMIPGKTGRKWILKYQLRKPLFG